MHGRSQFDRNQVRKRLKCRRNDHVKIVLLKRKRHARDVSGSPKHLTFARESKFDRSLSFEQFDFTRMPNEAHIHTLITQDQNIIVGE
jgi:hypothetical protein